MSQAAAKLRRAIPENDPAWQAALAAPLDDEPETDEERRAVADAMQK